MKIAGSRRMLIIGNGPSTAEVAGKLGRLPPDVDTFGMGAAYRYFRRVNWWPTYYALADQKVVYSHRNALAEIVEDPAIPIKRFYFAYPISSNPRCELIPHSSTGDFCYRKAIELGYKRIYLIGVEGTYVEEIAESRSLTGAEAEQLGFAGLRKRKNLRIVMSTPKSNPNYFFDDYQQEGDVYSLPEAAGHRDRWAASARLALYHNVSTWNLSALSAL